MYFLTFIEREADLRYIQENLEISDKVFGERR